MIGDFPFKTTFEELITKGDLQIGDGYRAKNNELGGNGIIFLRAGHVNDRGIDFSGADRFNDDVTANLEAKTSKAGDTIVTTKGNSTGRSSFVEEWMPEFVYSPHLSFWRSGNQDTIDNGFLRYWSKSKEFLDQLNGMKVSTDMAPYLSLTDQRRLQITLTSIQEQRFASQILSTLDDKIELNRKTNETLEGISKALFKSWFVDFDPVRAKAEGRPTGLPDEISELFPDSFEESELGEIPSGWKFVPLTQILQVDPKRSLPRGSVSPYLEMKAVPTSGHSADGVYFREFTSGTKFKNGDTLLARITPCLENGKTAMVDFLEGGQIGWGSTEFIVLCGIRPEHNSFAYFLARSAEFREHAIRNMVGSSGRQRVPSDALADFYLPQAPLSILNAFSSLADSLLGRISHASQENSTLSELRDALLPRLI